MNTWNFDAGVPGVEPVKVELTDFKTKEHVDTLEVDAVLVATGRAPYTQARAGTTLPAPRVIATTCLEPHAG